MHIVYVIDTTQAATVDRAKLYVNGQFVSWSNTVPLSLSLDTQINSTSIHAIARSSASADGYFDGYLTEVNFIDGQALTPSSFGQIETTTGVWSPKPYAGSYGTNGFYLKFGNTSSVAALGTDSSGNGNTWTVNNVSLTAGATYDSMIDVPVNYSDSGNGRGNYAVMNPLIRTTNNGGSISQADGNLSTGIGTFANTALGTIGVTSGKWYWEMIPTATNAGAYFFIGVVAQGFNNAAQPSSDALQWAYYAFNGNKNNNSNVAYGATYTTNDVIGVAVDMDVGTLTFYKNGATQGQAFSNLAGNTIFPMCSFGNTGSITVVSNFGQRPFAYTPPAGFRALNTNNLPTPSIVNGANFMAATTYTGNAAARSLSNAVNNVSFQPDLVWIKSRTPGATNHALFDSSRGVTKYLSSNTTTAETTLAQSLTALNADGFSLGTDTTLVNASANSYVAWQWRESITAGLDIVTYTGTGVTRTVAHNLGVAPAMIIIKDRGAAVNWVAYHFTQGAGKFLRLNTTDAATTDLTIWNNTAPTSSVFTVGGVAGVNANTNTYVAYCFAEIAGFSKFGSYTGNSSTDGPFVFCGFRPRFVMMKNSINGVSPWIMYDSSRDVSNVETAQLQPNSANTEASAAFCDFTANGFKVRTTGTSYNETGQTYIFAAFAEVPSKYALAR
jgi:hypothetical protein